MKAVLLALRVKRAGLLNMLVLQARGACIEGLQSEHPPIELDLGPNFGVPNSPQKANYIRYIAGMSPFNPLLHH